MEPSEIEITGELAYQLRIGIRIKATIITEINGVTMSSIACPEALVQVSETSTSRRDIAAACKAIRKGWSDQDRECRKTLADMKQISLLLNTAGLAGLLQKRAG